MSRKKRYSIYIMAALVATLATQSSATAMDSRDVGKEMIESPVKIMLRKSSAPVQVTGRSNPPDVSKMRIERSAKLLIRNSSTPALKSSVKRHSIAKKNYVKPGLVKWHQDLGAARRASKKSGKPLLVFHMMGRLDDRFC